MYLFFPEDKSKTANLLNSLIFPKKQKIINNKKTSQTEGGKMR